jgi:septum formation protein
LPKDARVPELVIATTSPYRLALLARLGTPFVAVPHQVDERAAEPPGDPTDAARALAVAKAQSVAAAHPDALILGSDQLAVDADGARLHKPGTAEAAVAQLARLTGRAHRLVTAVALRHPDGRVTSHVDVTVLHMRALTMAQLRAYVARDLPLDCAGAYKIERLGAALFERVVGHDPTAIEGLPLCATARLLADAGVDVLTRGVDAEAK